MTSWQVVDERVIYDARPWVIVREQDLMLPGGEHLEGYVLLDERDGCLVAAVTTGGELILLRQYRHGRGEPETGLPAGFLEGDDADPLETARRELLEETGHASDRWTSLGVLFTNSNRGRQVFHFFLALDAVPIAEQSLEPGEDDAELFLLPVEEVEAWLVSSNGDVGMAATAGILLALSAIRKER